MYEIEDGIPVPRRKSPNERYPWHDLGLEQSFFVPSGNLKSLRAAASQMKRKTKHDYLVRAVDGGVRIWRVA